MSLKYKHGKFREVSQAWIILYGSENMDDRERMTFLKESEAEKFRKDRVAKGFYADLFTEITTIETKKLT